MFHPYAGVTGIRFDGSTQAMCPELSAQKNWAPRGIGAMRGGDACSVKATKGTLEREMKNPNASRVDAMWAHPTWRPKRPDIA